MNKDVMTSAERKHTVHTSRIYAAMATLATAAGVAATLAANYMGEKLGSLLHDPDAYDMTRQWHAMAEGSSVGLLVTAGCLAVGALRAISKLERYQPQPVAVAPELPAGFLAGFPRAEASVAGRAA